MFPIYIKATIPESSSLFSPNLLLDCISCTFEGAGDRGPLGCVDFVVSAPWALGEGVCPSNPFIRMTLPGAPYCHC